MPNENVAIRAYFSRLGLEPDLADLYIALHAYGAQGILQLSRHSGIERRRIYRLLDALVEANLVEIETHYKRSMYRAAPISNLQILLSKKEQELRELEQQLHEVDGLLRGQYARSPLTHVQFYRGIEGLKQMFWNETKGKTDNLAILYETMQHRTSSAFFRRWVERCNATNAKFRGIIGEHFIETLQSWYATHSSERLKNWEPRYIAPEILPVTHSTVTYDDVVAFYNWKDGEIFGVELYNSEIAAAQRHMFELLWRHAQPIDDLKGRLKK